MYIVDPDVMDEDLEPIVERYKKIVTDMGGVVGDTGKWEGGRRRLAYEIKGKREGVYILMNFEAGPGVTKELDRVFGIDERVLRHLTVLKDPKAPTATPGPLVAPAPAQAEAPAPTAEPVTSPASEEAAAPQVAPETAEPEAPAATEASEEAPGEAIEEAPAEGSAPDQPAEATTEVGPDTEA